MDQSTFLFLILGDDDTYQNVPRILELCQEKAIDSRNKSIEKMLREECLEKPNPIFGRYCKISGMEHRIVQGNFWDKWLIPPYIINQEFPAFIIGFSLIWPRNVIPCLASSTWNYPFTHTDDIWVAFMNGPCNITILDIPDYEPHQSKPPKEPDLKTAAVHLDSAGDLIGRMKDMHFKFRTMLP